MRIRILVALILLTISGFTLASMNETFPVDIEFSGDSASLSSGDLERLTEMVEKIKRRNYCGFLANVWAEMNESEFRTPNLLILTTLRMMNIRDALKSLGFTVYLHFVSKEMLVTYSRGSSGIIFIEAVGMPAKLTNKCPTY
ncbi:MAG: hypothetical protein WCK63_13830 [Betaproteobacteria bacterium]